MNHMIQIGKNGGHDLLWLGVWPKNLKAIRFYEKFGFKVIGEHEFPLGDQIDVDNIMAINLL